MSKKYSMGDSKWGVCCILKSEIKGVRKKTVPGSRDGFLYAWIAYISHNIKFLAQWGRIFWLDNEKRIYWDLEKNSMICEEICSIRCVDGFADEKQGYIWHKSIWMPVIIGRKICYLKIFWGSCNEKSSKTVER